MEERMKLFFLQLLWILLFPLDLLLASVMSVALTIVSLFGVYETRYDGLLELPPFPLPDPVEQLVGLVFVSERIEPQATVAVGDLDIAVNITFDKGGYRVSAKDDSSIFGFGRSVAAAKYDFYLTYRSWLQQRGFSSQPVCHTTEVL
jgi:hypothetical protein